MLPWLRKKLRRSSSAKVSKPLSKWRTYVPSLERLEDRLTPAVPTTNISFAANVLTIQLTGANETVTLDTDGSNDLFISSTGGTSASGTAITTLGFSNSTGNNVANEGSIAAGDDVRQIVIDGTASTTENVIIAGGTFTALAITDGNINDVTFNTADDFFANISGNAVDANLAVSVADKIMLNQNLTTQPVTTAITGSISLAATNGLTLTSDATLDTTNGGTVTTGGNISIGAVAGGGHALTLNAGTSGTITATDAIDDVSTLTVTNSGGATFEGGIGAGTAGAVTLTDTTGTIAFEGTTTHITTLTTAAVGYNVSLDSTTTTIDTATTFSNTGTVTLGGSWTLSAALTIDGNFTNNGTLDLNGSAFTVDGTLTNSGTIELQGGEAVTLANGNDTTQGTWVYYGDGLGDTITINHFGATDYYNLTIDDQNSSPDTFEPSTALNIAGAFTISGGTYDADSFITDVTGLTTVSGGATNGGTYQTSTVLQTLSGGLTVTTNTNAGTFTGSTGDVSTSNVTISGGTLTAPSGTFDVSGNWSYTSGTFTPGTNTVTFDGSSTQTLDSGGQSFWSVIYSGASTLQLGNNALTIGGTLTNSNASGTIDLNGEGLSVTSTVSNTGTIALRGTETVTLTAGNDTAKGTWLYYGDGLGDTITINHFGATDYWNLKIDDQNSVTDTYTPAADLVVAKSFTLSGGTFSQGTNDVSVAGNFTLASGTTFTKATGGKTLTFDGTGTLADNNATTQDLGAVVVSSGTRTLNTDISASSLTINGGTFDANGHAATVSGLTKVNGGTYDASTTTQTLSGGLTVTTGNFTGSTGNVSTSNVTINGGTLTAPSGTFDVSGNWSYTSGTFTPGTNTVTFDGSSAQTLDSGGQSFWSIVYSPTATATLQLSNNALTVGGTLTNSNASGTIDLNGESLSVTSTVSNTGTIALRGTETVTLTAGNDTAKGTWLYYGDGLGDTITINHFGATDYWNLKINDQTAAPDTFEPSTALVIAHAFTISGGTYNAAGFATNVTGLTTVSGGATNGGTYQASTVLQTLSGGLTVTTNTKSGTFTGSTGDVSTSNVTISGGTLTAPSGTFDVSGNWSLTSGTFTPGTNTVTLDGTGQALSGATTFYNLDKTVSTADTLTFGTGATNKTTITHTLTLQGASGNLLSLRSATTGMQWQIDSQGTNNVSYVDVKDSDNVDAVAIGATNATDSLDNLNWVFVSTGGVITVNVTAGSNLTNATLQRSGTNLEVVDSASNVIVTVAESSVTSIAFNGANGVSNMLTVDGTLNFGAHIPFTFNGGTGSGSDNTLKISGGTFTNEIVGYGTSDANGHDGTVSLDGQVITFNHLQPLLLDVGSAANEEFDLPNSNNLVSFEASLDPLTTPLQLRSTNSPTATFETTEFTDPTSSLLIKSASGTTNTVTVASNLPSAFNAALTYSGTDTDAVIVNAALALGTGSTTGTLSITANTIDINNTIDTTQGNTAGTIDLTTSGTNALVTINTSSITSGGADQTYDSAVTLSHDTQLTAANVTFDKTVDSDTTARNLEINASGTTTFDGQVGFTNALASLTVDAPNGTSTTDINGGTTNGSTITTTGTQDYKNLVVLTADALLTANGTNANVTFEQTLDSDAVAARNLEINATGTTTFKGQVGSKHALASLTVDAPNGTSTTDINGGTTNGATITTTGNQDYKNLVVLTADAKLTATGTGANVTFEQTLDSDAVAARNLEISATGTTTFKGQVGSKHALASLTVDAPNGTSTTDINGGTTNGATITTTGNQDYKNLVVLTADAKLTATGTGANVTFEQTLDSKAGTNWNLEINATGTTKFDGQVGFNRALASLTVDAPNGTSTTDINGGTTNGATITTTGNQDYKNLVVLTADAKLTATGTGANVTFEQTLDSDTTARKLEISATGITEFEGLVGNSQALASLTIDAPTLTSTTDINSGLGNGSQTSITTVGNQDYKNIVVLTADTKLATTQTIPNGTNVTFEQTVDSDADATPRKLEISATGTTTFDGLVGATHKLASLTIDAPTLTSTTDINSGLGNGTQTSITTVGNQDYKNIVVLTADTKLATTQTSPNGTNITFEQTLDSDAVNTPRKLEISATGITEFEGLVGNSQALASLTIDAPTLTSTTDINSGLGNGSQTSITTVGNQDYKNIVVLTADTKLATTQTIPNGTNITFEQTVDSDADATPRNLEISATGTTTFDGQVGATHKLASLTIDAPTAASTTDINGGITPTAGSITSTGNQDYKNIVVLTADTLLTTTAANATVTFEKTVDSKTNALPWALTVNATGTTTFDGQVGSTHNLSSLHVAGATKFSSNTTSVTTTTTQTYDGAATLDTTLTGNALTLNATMVTMGSTVQLNANTLTLNVSSTTAPASSINGAISDTGTGGSLLLEGGGTLYLPTGSTSTYKGTTTITSGTLVVTGTIASVVHLNQSSGNTALLRGTGTVGGIVADSGGGTVQPGLAGTVGILTSTGNVTLNGKTTYSVQLNGKGTATASAMATIGANNKVNGIILLNGGSGYTAQPIVTLSGGGGSAATVTATVGIGQVTSITIANGGSGYTSAPTVHLTGGSFTTAATATAAINGVTGITVTSPGSGYTSAPTVTLTGGGGSGATATATVIGGVVTGITVTNPGSGYTTTPTITFTGGGGTGAGATAAVGFHQVTSITINNPGSGYTATPTVSFTGGGFTTQAIATAAFGGVTGFNITNVGSGYTSAPTVTITSPAPATGQPTVSHDQVTAITVTHGGSGYTLAPTVTLSGGGATTQATATAIINGSGVVTGITVNTPGSGYTSLPTITFTGGGGTGAAATATLGGQVTGINVTFGGSGYSSTSPPLVTLLGGGGSGATATATVNGSGVITGFNVNMPGSGYTSAPTVLIGGTVVVPGVDYDSLTETSGTFTPGGATLNATLGTASNVNDVFEIVNSNHEDPNSNFTPTSFTFSNQAFPVQRLIDFVGGGVPANFTAGNDVVISHLDTAPTQPTLTITRIPNPNFTSGVGYSGFTGNTIVQTEAVNLTISFTDFDQLDSHGITVNWGDGPSSNGSAVPDIQIFTAAQLAQLGVQNPFTGSFTVTVSHPYFFPQNATVAVTVNDGQKSSTPQTTPVTVLDAILRNGTGAGGTSGSFSVPAIQNQSTTTLNPTEVAFFTDDAAAEHSAGSFHVVINWQDGTISDNSVPGSGISVIPDPKVTNGYDVIASHNFSGANQFQPTIGITSDGKTSVFSNRPAHSRFASADGTALSTNPFNVVFSPGQLGLSGGAQGQGFNLANFQQTESFIARITTDTTQYILQQILPKPNISALVPSADLQVLEGNENGVSIGTIQALAQRSGLGQAQIDTALIQGTIDQVLFSPAYIAGTVAALYAQFGVNPSAQQFNLASEFLTHGGTRQQLAILILGSPSFSNFSSQYPSNQVWLNAVQQLYFDQFGVVSSVKVTNGGSGYSTPTVTIAGVTGLTGSITVVGGVVTNIIATGGTSGYSAGTVVPLTISAPGGSGITATATATFNADGTIASISVTNGGSGYATPTVTFTGTGGSGAAAVVTVTGDLTGTNGRVTAITLLNQGKQYPPNTTVTISPPQNAGTRATASVTVTGSYLLPAGNWLGQLNAGTSRLQVANSLLTSDSGNSVQIEYLAETYLGLPAAQIPSSMPNLAYWLNRMHQVTLNEVEFEFLNDLPGGIGGGQTPGSGLGGSKNIRSRFPAV